MKVSGAGVKSNIQGVLLDLSESWEGFIPQNNSVTPPCEQRGYAPESNGNNNGASQIFPANFGGAVVLAYDATAGRSLISTVSLAGTQHGRAPTAASTTGVKIPLGQRFGGAAGVLPIPFYRPLRRYTLRVPVRITALAGGAAFVGCSDGAAGELAGLPFSCAYGWVADPTLNGGRWTARFRQVAGGAITTVGDSGILSGAVTWREVGLRYTEGATPTVEWLMDGVPVFQVAGDANMGTVASSALGPFPCISTLLGAGTTLQNAAGRFIVEELGS